MIKIHSGLQKFLIKTGTLLLVVMLFAVCLWSITRKPPTSNLYLQKDRLENIASPRLIFLGGSNCLFGIDSELLEQQLGLPVINDCIQAGLPLGYYFRELRPYLRKGDVVVMILEYGFYADVRNPEAITNILDSYPEGIASLIPDVWQSSPDLLRRLSLKWFNRLLFGYRPQIDKFNRIYNQWGDGTYLLDYHDEITIDVSNGSIPDSELVEPSVLDEIASFQGEARMLGAEIYISYPSMWNRQFDPQAEQAEQLDTLLRERFPGMVISSPADYVFRKNFISNTSYHLNREGRAIRTKQLIADLLAADLQAR